MKAALLNKFGSPLEVGTLPDPVPGAGEIIVDVVAAGVLSYTGEVFSGARNYEMELPLVPGTAGVYSVIFQLSNAQPADPATQLTIAQQAFVSNVVTFPVVASPTITNPNGVTPASRPARAARPAGASAPK